MVRAALSANGMLIVSTAVATLTAICSGADATRMTPLGSAIGLAEVRHEERLLFSGGGAWFESLPLRHLVSGAAHADGSRPFRTGTPKSGVPSAR